MLQGGLCRSVYNYRCKSTKVNTKEYICLFVCFVTKTVHIKLVINLFINAFLNCLKKFIAHQGLCYNIYSDNWTNFVRTRNELIEFKRLILSKKKNSKITQFFLNKKIRWHIIPPCGIYLKINFNIDNFQIYKYSIHIKIY